MSFTYKLTLLIVINLILIYIFAYYNFLDKRNMDKKHIINIIQETCKKEGWSYHLNYKGKDWKADIVIEQPSSKIAFNICKCPRNIETIYKTMLEDNTFGCWLLLPVDRYVDYDKNTPCFKLYEVNEQINVTLYST